MSEYNKISLIGTSDISDPELKDRVKLTNNIAVIALLLCLVQLFTTGLMLKDLIPHLLALIFLCILSIAMNALQLWTVSRLLITVGSMIVFWSIHISFIAVGEPLMVSTLTVQMSLLVLPWMVFSIKEVNYALVSSLIGFGCILLVDPLNGWIEPSQPSDILRTGFTHYSAMFSAVVIVLVSLYMLNWKSNSALINVQQLLAESEKNQAVLEQSKVEMQTYISELDKAKQEDKKREWVTLGLNKFAEVLQRNRTNADRYNVIVTEIVKYLQANQGGLFLVQNDASEVYFDLKACYAYDRLKFLKKRVEVREGLIGECYFEREYIYLKEIPDKYTLITSGLGGATPRALLLVPCMYDESVEAIFELASFKDFQPHQIDFVKKVGEILASNIHAWRTEQQMKDMVASLQEQTETLKMQEEEMAQNMEELAATQEEMGRKQKILEEKERMLQSIINNTPGAVFRCYTDSNWTMLFISPKCQQILGYTDEDFMHHRVHVGTIIHPDDVAYAEKEAYSALAESRQYELRYRLRHKQGHYIYVWEMGTYAGKDDSGKELIEGQIIDITEFIEKEKQLQSLLFENKEIKESLEAKIELLELKIKRKDQELEEIKSKLNT